MTEGDRADIAENPVPPGRSEDRGRPPIARRPVFVIAAVAAIVHLLVATRFGWHRDEFYYVLCGRHPDWGYVDQPPLAPLLARLAAELPGGVLPLRLLAIAAQIGCVLLASVLAAEFGGRRRAQTLAAAAVAACPVFVAASMLFGTTVLDQLSWVAVLVLTARALRSGTTRAWLTAGLVAGIGLQTKDTLAVLLIGIVVGLLAFRRDALRGRGPWLAGVLAILIAVPNIIWDARHQWANLHMAQALADQQGGPLGALTQIPTLVSLLAGPPLIALWYSGVRHLISHDGREHRWLLAASVVVLLLFTVSGGKVYYAAPVLAGLFAAGAVRVEGLAPKRWRWPLAVAVSALLAIVIGLPVLPPRAETALRPVDPQAMETYGWPGFVDQIARAAAPLPAEVPIFASNYGEAGAVSILGPAAGLHRTVLSGHNNYLLWGPPPGTPDTVPCVGQWNTTYLHRFWSQVIEIAPLTLPDGLTDQETAQHAAIYLCTQPLGTWAQLWPGLRHLD
ncbi:glycosyltransferase family 39 protein [Nocardia jiangxiensis]|uniref:glycosyltransferase family 39 protein n=1 Tax=Nocardia jiangxiensis TaxID=282685 RepID=UPI00031CE761|nr:glycosyltransferase family 39 protein [Nocardia jiangxiensis]